MGPKEGKALKKCYLITWLVHVHAAFLLFDECLFYIEPAFWFIADPFGQQALCCVSHFLFAVLLHNANNPCSINSNGSDTLVCLLYCM